jgi:uncharacterized protein (DUF736 family)
MALTYEVIQTATVDNSAPTVIELASIPGTYTDLLITISVRTTANINADQGALYIRFNSNTANYYNVRLDGFSGNTAADANARLIATYGGGTQVTANTFNNIEFYIPSYTSANTKNAYSFYAGLDATGNLQYDLGIVSQSWENSAAITNLRVALASNEVGNAYAQYSNVTIWGIKKA